MNKVLGSLFIFLVTAESFDKQAGEDVHFWNSSFTSSAKKEISTPPSVERRSVTAKVVGCAAFASLSITGITGNSLVIYAIFTDPSVQTRNQLSNLAILNLAYTDLMTTSLVSFPAAVLLPFEEYRLGPIVCKIWAILNIVGIVATMGLLMVISVDRFIAVRWPLHYPQWVTYPRLFGACCYIWISTFSCVMAWGLFPCDYDVWAGICDFTWHLFGPKVPAAFWYGIACTIYFFSIPSMIILGCNAAIIQMSRGKVPVGNRQTSRLKVFQRITFRMNKIAWVAGNHGQNNVQKPRIVVTSSSNRILKGMLTVISAYFLLTFPVALIRVVKLLSGPDGLAQHIPGWLTFLCSFLQFSASIVNPMIYGLLRKDFRNSYRRVLRKILKQPYFDNVVFLADKA